MADPRYATLWGITCYFNPVGYRRRLDNYRIFRQRLKVPLVAVELSFDKKFQLASADADILVQLHGSAVLWQKERLLNVALKSLPQVCDKVAWLDCDIVFEVMTGPSVLAVRWMSLCSCTCFGNETNSQEISHSIRQTSGRPIGSPSPWSTT